MGVKWSAKRRKLRAEWPWLPTLEPWFSTCFPGSLALAGVDVGGGNYKTATVLSKVFFHAFCTLAECTVLVCGL
jgi:hypothetical protein